MGSHDRDRSVRRGITLIELVVVISLLVILAAIAIPAVRPAVEGRRIRETARGISTYFSSARSRAMETGRPCGVVIRRFVNAAGNGQPEMSVLLEQVEVPPTYAGETVDSRARLNIAFTNDPDSPVNYVNAQFSPPIRMSPSPTATDVVHVGDFVRFNGQGPLYTVTTIFSNSSMTLSVDARRGQLLPWPSSRNTAKPYSDPLTYEFQGRPKKSYAAPFRLPTGAAIDLQFSGTDSNPTAFANDNQPIYIMFSPNGSIDRVYVGNGVAPAVEPIYLLVGPRENIPFDPNDEASVANWRDLNNVWLTIQPQTGLVNVNRIAAADDMLLSREIAREGKTMGGN